MDASAPHPDSKATPADLSAVPPMSAVNAAAPAAVAAESASPSFVARIPGYRVIERLGQGGMGVVWLAEQQTPRRLVAIKTLAASLGGRRARLRFEREIELAGRLSHPNISRVYGGDEIDGVGYYVMELLRGQSLDEYARAHRPDDRAVVRLMIDVCEGVAHAHQAGVIHRDLKPSNVIIVESVDPAGQKHLVPKVLDFGLARDLDQDSKLTLSGELSGTAAYMSPEQARGDPAAINTRSDVYALGVILYQLLTHHTPHEQEGSRFNLLRRKCDDEPRPPENFRRDLPTDLAVVVSKAIRRQASERYAGAAELADDLRRFLDGRPVAARPHSSWYLARRFASRHRAGLSIAAAVVAVVLTTAIMSYARISEARTQAEADAHSAKLSAIEANTQRNLAEDRRKQTERALVRSLIAEGDAQLQSGRYVVARHRFEEARAKLLAAGESTWPADLALIEAVRRAPYPLATLKPEDTSPVSAVAIARDGRTGLVGHRSGRVEVWDLPLSRRLRTITVGPREVTALVASPAANEFFAATEDAAAAVWNIDGTRRLAIDAGESVTCAAYSPDGARLAMGGSSTMVSLRRAEDGSAIWRSRPASHWICSIAFSRDGAYLVRGARDLTAAVLDTIDARQIHAWNMTRLPRCAAFPATGRTVVVAGHVSGAQAFPVDPAAEPAILSLDGGEVRALCDFDGGVSAITDDGTVTQFDSDNRPTWRYQVEDFSGIASATRDGTLLLVGQSGGAASVYPLNDRRERLMTNAGDRPTCAALSPDGRVYVTGCETGDIDIRDRLSGRYLWRKLLDSPGQISALAFSPDSRLLAIARPPGRVQLFNLADGQISRQLSGAPSDVRGMRWTDDLKTVIAVDGSRLLVWNDGATTPSKMIPLLQVAAGVVGPGDSPDRVRLVSERGQGFVVSLSAGIALPVGPERPRLSATPVLLDDGTIFSAHTDGTLRRWKLGDNTDQITTTIPGGQIRSLAILPGLPLLLIGTSDGVLGVLDSNTLTTHRLIRASPASIRRMACSTANPFLLTLDETTAATVWDFSALRPATASPILANTAVSDGSGLVAADRIPVGRMFLRRRMGEFAVAALTDNLAPLPGVHPAELGMAHHLAEHWAQSLAQLEWAASLSDPESPATRSTTNVTSYYNRMLFQSVFRERQPAPPR